MSVLGAAARHLHAVSELAWQISAVPADLARSSGADPRSLPFLAAVTGTAALGLVDWPVALLVAGGYALARRPGMGHPPDLPVLPVLPRNPAAAVTRGPAGRETAGSDLTKPPPRQSAAPPAAAGEPAPSQEPAESRRADPGAGLSEPWPGYDAMTVPQIIQQLDRTGRDPAAVGQYEAAHRNRKMVRAAVTARLGGRR